MAGTTQSFLHPTHNILHRNCLMDEAHAPSALSAASPYSLVLLWGLPAQKATQSLMTGLLHWVANWSRVQWFWVFFKNRKQTLDSSCVSAAFRTSSQMKRFKWGRKIGHDLEGSRLTWRSVIISLFWNTSLRAHQGGVSASCDKMEEIITLQLPRWQYYGNRVAYLS